MGSPQGGVAPTQRTPAKGEQNVLVCPVVKVAGQKQLNEFTLQGEGNRTWSPVAVAGKISDAPDVSGRSYFHTTDVIATEADCPLGLLFSLPADLPAGLTLQFRTQTMGVETLTEAEWLVVRKKLLGE